MKLASCLELFCCGECVQNGTSVSGTVVFTLAEMDSDIILNKPDLNT